MKPDDENTEIIRTIVMLAHALNLDVIAEGLRRKCKSPNYVGSSVSRVRLLFCSTHALFPSLGMAKNYQSVEWAECSKSAIKLTRAYANGGHLD
jgi:hypothetical protein